MKYGLPRRSWDFIFYASGKITFEEKQNMPGVAFHVLSNAHQKCGIPTYQIFKMISCSKN